MNRSTDLAVILALTVSIAFAQGQQPARRAPAQPARPATQAAGPPASTYQEHKKGDPCGSPDLGAELLPVDTTELIGSVEERVLGELNDALRAIAG